MKISIVVLLLIVGLSCAYGAYRHTAAPGKPPVVQAPETANSALKNEIIQLLHCQEDEADEIITVLNELGIDGVTDMQTAQTAKGMNLKIICGTEHYLFRLSSKFGVERVENSSGKGIYTAIY